ncbi:MAG: hypothetical protein Q7K98_07240 [Candidatus Omnitrophota bacterium]|nr:hypothetical protein [Candidatus Omnitrophota bacterium]
MLKQVGLLLILNLCFQGLIFAEEKAKMEDGIIGSTFKVLAKTFVSVADINKIKKNNIDRLNKMKEEKFKKRYAEVYKVIKDLPVELKIRYGITETMTKEQAIRNIESPDKKIIYEMINSIPDAIIANQFKQYLSGKKQEIQKSNVVEQINKFWKNLIAKTNMASPAPKINRAGFREHN